MQLANDINRSDVVCLLAKYQRQSAYPMLSPRALPPHSLQTSDRFRSFSAPRERPRADNVLSFSVVDPLGDHRWAHLADVAKR
jgi:hypothetical protein